MASSSTSSVHKSFKYEVFLSFRGEDARKTFVDHLYHALQNKSIHTYKDDEKIKKGERINDELMKSIEDSKFYIIVFSKNYASSSWCLDELVKIIECQKTSEHTAYPVFYDVEPTEVRKQSGEFGKAFAEQEKKETAEKWREALKEASDLAGWELKNTLDGHEAKFIQKIVEEISLELRSINFSIDKKLIGMEDRLGDIVSTLEIGRDDVRMIGIKGMGGAGKTTLARAIFDHISFQFQFDGSSFIENVRENSNTNLTGLKKLQEQVLKDVLNDHGINISNVHDGKKTMKKMMHCRKVLIVLDDVDHTKQLEALAGELNWFNKGSRIIITTRDEQVLVAHRVNLIRDVNLLSDEEALCLFSRYAFGREIPIQGYEELSSQVVHYAAGLPLTIKVLGSFLCGKNELEWKNAIQRLKTIPSKGTLDILEVSYISLEEEHKEIFLDVACILKDWHKEDAIRVLESCGFYARIGLRVLEQKSLITISRDGCLDMHDKIEEMGQYIVRRLHPEEPNKHSRLWIQQEIKDILVSDQGTNEAVRCIELSTIELNPEIVKGLGNMKKLRFLQVYSRHDVDFRYSNWEFDEVREYFPNALRCLRWIDYPFGSLPKSFQANNLVQLEMAGGKIVQLWEGGDRKVLNNLRFLDLRCSKLKNLDLGLTPNLETLDLEGCRDLVELHMPAEWPKLISLKLGDSKLRTLVFPKTPNLETLRVEECVDLVELHIPVECLKLKSINIYNSKLRTLDLRGTPNLETLHVERCVDLVELHISVECLKLKSININGSKLRALDLRGTPNLETLRVEDCVDLVELHIPVECLKLKSINIYGSKLRTLDLQGARNLETLSVAECVDLIELHIPVECLNLECINIHGSKLRTLDLGGTPNVKWLSFRKCYHLVEVYAPLGCLKKLICLELIDCLGFQSFEFEKWFESLEVGSLSELHLIAESLDMCPLHSDNNLPKFQFECFYKEHSPSSLGNVEKLISIGLCACTNLENFSRNICGLHCLTKLILQGSIEEVPRELDQLDCLLELNFLSTKITHLPDSICKLKHLKRLELQSCYLLEKLPEDLGLLERLEVLILWECTVLQDIPNSICDMKHLEYFLLSGCTGVEKLPEEIGRLICLKELRIDGTDMRRLPDSIFELKGLCVIGSKFLLELCGFTSEIQTIEDETECYVEL